MNRHTLIIPALVTLLSLACSSAMAQSNIRILATPSFHSTWTAQEVKQLVEESIDAKAYREVRVQNFGDHMVLQLLSKTYHKMEFVRLDLGADHSVVAAHSPYVYTAQELKLQNDRSIPSCPDPSVQVLAVCPNNVPLEVQTTNDVADEARAKGYKVVTLLGSQATRLNYLAYMSCPNLVGNFYDGDASPSTFNVFDGVISAHEISAAKGLFRQQVTNIWVACEAYNDPMLSAVTVAARSQKYAAGINDLLVGPSDEAAACAMKAAVDGLPMTDAFNNCYKQLDTPEDHWGFGGSGSDLFAHSH